MAIGQPLNAYWLWNQTQALLYMYFISVCMYFIPTLQFTKALAMETPLTLTLKLITN